MRSPRLLQNGSLTSETVTDFATSPQIFPDADVLFPSYVVASHPAVIKENKSAMTQNLAFRP